MQIALFQPDIPQNAGTILRLCACLNVEAHIIEPAGFPVSDRHFRRAGMDYLDQVTITRHDLWSKFEQWRNDNRYRLILFTTKASLSYLDYSYGPADILLFGRESAGVPDEVVAAADARLVIPIRSGMRSLNVAVSAAMALGEALRQTSSDGSAPAGSALRNGHLRDRGSQGAGKDLVRSPARRDLRGLRTARGRRAGDALFGRSRAFRADALEPDRPLPACPAAAA